MIFSKRLFDLVLAWLSLIIASPFMVLIALLILVNHGRPILFTQQRPGHKGRPFKLHKFRTMSNRLSRDGGLLPDAERLTSLGRFLRTFSLDEMPELFNILKGEMSLVGPRPLLMDYLPLYSAEQMRRHDMLPGLTGWAQVNGRNTTDWPTRFALDIWYVDHWSFWLDIKIILMTVWKVLTREGVNQEGQATVEYFKGNR